MLLKQHHPDQFVITGSWIQSSHVEAPSSGSNYNYKGAILQDYTGTVTTPVWEFIKDQAFSFRVPEFETIREIGNYRIVSVGDAKGKRRYQLLITPIADFTEVKFHGYIPGTKGEDTASIIISKLSGKQSAIWNGAKTQWNRLCWGFDFDLTGVIMQSSFAGGWTKERGGCLITPRHILNASHYPIGVGFKVRFLTKGETPAQDQIIERTIVSQYSGWDEFGTDHIVSVLNTDVPSSIAPLSLVDTSDWTEQDGLIDYNRAPGMYAGKLSDLVIKPSTEKDSSGISSLDTRINSFAVVDGITQSSIADPSFYRNWIDEWIPFWSDYKDFIRPLLSGDSGSPSLVPISETEVGLLSCSGGVTESQINSMIASADSLAGISTGYTISIASPPL